jgi:hypothetical protein
VLVEPVDQFPPERLVLCRVGEVHGDGRYRVRGEVDMRVR